MWLQTPPNKASSCHTALPMISRALRFPTTHNPNTKAEVDHRHRSANPSLNPTVLIKISLCARGLTRDFPLFPAGSNKSTTAQQQRNYSLPLVTNYNNVVVVVQFLPPQAGKCPPPRPRTPCHHATTRQSRLTARNAQQSSTQDVVSHLRNNHFVLLGFVFGFESSTRGQGWIASV